MRPLLTTGLIAGLTLAGAALAQEAASPEAPEAGAGAAAPEAPEAGSEAPEAAVDYDAGTVLARVNGTEITLGHAIVARGRLPEQYRELPDETLMTGILDQLIDQSLLAEEAAAEGGDEPLAVRLHLENERRGALAAQVVEARMAEAIDEAAVQTAYDAAIAGFEPQPEFSASHILVESEERALELKAELEGGADFAELATTSSSDAGSAANGGSLGWFGAGRMVPEFEAALGELEPGEISAPVETQFGWHVIRLDETRETAPPPIEEVRPQIEQALRQEALQAELQGLRSGAEIERNATEVPAAAIRDDDLLDE